MIQILTALSFAMGVSVCPMPSGPEAFSDYIASASKAELRFCIEEKSYALEEYVAKKARSCTIGHYPRVASPKSHVHYCRHVNRQIDLLQAQLDALQGE